MHTRVAGVFLLDDHYDRMLATQSVQWLAAPRQASRTHRRSAATFPTFSVPTVRGTHTDV